jgi:hypothetical protein
MKIPAVGAELFVPCGRTDIQTDREIDMINLILAFRNFSNEPKNAVRSEKAEEREKQKG